MNLPTRITVARIALIPLFILLFCLNAVFKQYYIPMTIVFIIASCTDFVDGHLARKHNLVTDLGKFLDPIADKILVVAGMIVLLRMNFVTSTGAVYPVLAPYFGEICVTLILAREFIIGVFRQLAASKGVVMAADKLGKAKTIVTLIALPMLMLVPLINEPWHKAVNWIGVGFLFVGWVLFGVATILTVVSGFNYIWKNRHALKTEQEPCEPIENEKSECNCLSENEVSENAQCANLDVLGVEIGTMEVVENNTAQNEEGNND